LTPDTGPVMITTPTNHPHKWPHATGATPVPCNWRTTDMSGQSAGRSRWGPRPTASGLERLLSGFTEHPPSGRSAWSAANHVNYGTAAEGLAVISR